MCIYVCVCVCTHACTHAPTYSHTNVCIHISSKHPLRTLSLTNFSSGLALTSLPPPLHGPKCKIKMRISL